MRWVNTLQDVFFQAHPGTEVLEVAVGGQGRRGEDKGSCFFIEEILHALGNVERRRMKHNRLFPLLIPLQPFGVCGTKDFIHGLPQLIGAVREGLEGWAVFFRESGLAVDEIQALPDFRAGSSVEAVKAFIEKPASFFAFSQKIPEMLGSCLDPLQVPPHFLLLLIREVDHCFLDIVYQIQKLAGAEALSEISRRNVFQGVSLVKDHRLEPGNDLSEPLFLDHQVRKKKMMIHDNELGLRSCLTETVEEAIFVEHALASHALIRSG